MRLRLRHDCIFGQAEACAGGKLVESVRPLSSLAHPLLNKTEGGASGRPSVQTRSYRASFREEAE